MNKLQSTIFEIVNCALQQLKVTEISLDQYKKFFYFYNWIIDILTLNKHKN